MIYQVGLYVPVFSDTVTNCGQLSDFTDAGHHIVIPQSGSGMYMLCEYNVKYAHYLGNGPITDIAGPSESSEHIMVSTPDTGMCSLISSLIIHCVTYVKD